MFAPAALVKEMWEFNFQREVHPNGLTLSVCFPWKQNDVSRGYITIIAVTVKKIEREENCKIYGLLTD